MNNTPIYYKDAEQFHQSEEEDEKDIEEWIQPSELIRVYSQNRPKKLNGVWMDSEERMKGLHFGIVTVHLPPIFSQILRILK